MSIISQIHTQGRAEKPVEQRVSTLNQRIKRSNERVATADSPQRITDIVLEDSLMNDAVSRDALEYEAFVRSKGNSRKDLMDEGDDDDDDNDMQDDDDEEDDYDDKQEDNYDDDDECDDCHDILVPGTKPSRRADDPLFPGVQRIPNPSMLHYSSKPDASDRRTVRTMEEIVTPSAATRQFETNMDFVSGPTSASGVIIRRGTDLYKDIDKKLSRPLTSQAFRR